MKVVDNADQITSKIIRELFLSKVSYLEKSLYFFDNICSTEVTVYVKGEVVENRLMTSVTIDCADENYKRMIEEDVIQYIYWLHPYEN
jgi:hypothetical protein